MNSRRMMAVGVMMVLAAIAILLFALFMVGEEEESLKKAARFEGGAAGAAAQGDLVIIEGRVSVKNKILTHDYVDAAKENNDKGTWTILQVYHQPVLADLAQGEIILASAQVCTRPDGINALKTDEITPNKDPIRFVGLKRGDPIAAIGTLTSSVPAALAVKYWYSGSVADYKEFISSSRKGSYIFFAVLAALGAGLFVLGFKKR